MNFYETIPKRVRVGSYYFRIEVGEASDHETEATFGHMNPVSQKIRLRPGMTAQNLANTFIHECIHAMNFCSGAGRNCEDWGESEEDYTTKIANSLCTFWQDNPEAVAWWACVNKLDSAVDMVVDELNELLTEEYNPETKWVVSSVKPVTTLKGGKGRGKSKIVKRRFGHV